MYRTAGREGCGEENDSSAKKGDVFTLVWPVTAVVLMMVIVNGNHLYEFTED